MATGTENLVKFVKMISEMWRGHRDTEILITVLCIPPKAKQKYDTSLQNVC